MKRIYVQSGGISQDDDYQWKEINFDNDTQDIVDCPLLVKSFKHLLDSKAPSLLLARSNKQLLLLVTDIPSQRRDYMNRIIRNSVAWIGENKDEDEQILKALAIRGLQSLLGEDYSFPLEINNAVKSDANKGFIVNREGLQAEILAQDFQLEDKSQNLPPRIEYKIATKGEQRVNELIDELKKHNLPQHDGALVVVTKNKAELALKNAKVWRGLSALVESNDWQKYSVFSEELSGVKKRSKKNLMRPLIILLIILLSSGIIVRSLINFFGNNPPNTPLTLDTKIILTAKNSGDPTTLESLEFGIKKTIPVQPSDTPNNIATTSNIGITVGNDKEDDSLTPVIISVPLGINEQTTYSFTPVIGNLKSQNLQFAIDQKPDWATFDSNTGKLSGTPNKDDVGKKYNLIITVSDKKETINLLPFSLTVNQ
ncbi:putative Ig domain-containing protein [Dapis sp. BLCC M229]|uniref:putative Ig domain-containing protein n=1 Tax=Dapis sp. BLCC M229 TaxID=3400188 RepID=UPI003CF550EE